MGWGEAKWKFILKSNKLVYLFFPSLGPKIINMKTVNNYPPEVSDFDF